MASRNPDPKHGRWILPMVIVGMVLFTWIFVNGLGPAQTGTIGAEPSELTTTTTTLGTTTTTAPAIPPAVTTYYDAISARVTQVQGMLDGAERLNGDWEDRDNSGANFADTRDGLSELATEANTLVSELAEIGVPSAQISGVDEAHANLLSTAQSIASAAGGMVEGINSSDTGETRRAALDNFRTATTTFVDTAQAIPNLPLI